MGSEFNDITQIALQYTLAGTYAKSNGKFSAIYGNVAIVDCNYFLDKVLSTLQDLINDKYHCKTQPTKYIE